MSAHAASLESTDRKESANEKRLHGLLKGWEQVYGSELIRGLECSALAKVMSYKERAHSESLFDGETCLSTISTQDMFP